MRFRRDTGGEIGVFEDLQTLLVVVVAIVILLGSTLYNWSAIGSTERDQDLRDEAEHIVKQIEAWERLMAINSYGSQYPDFMLRQPDLATLVESDQFEDHVKSDLNYRVTFDDLTINETQHSPDDGIYSTYEFGSEPPTDANIVAITVQYALVMEKSIGPQSKDVSSRHPCLVTVEVWS